MSRSRPMKPRLHENSMGDHSRHDDQKERTRMLMRRRLRVARIRVMRRIPRKRHLRHTWVHRAFGERLFDPHIWHASRSGVAGGLAAGVLISFTPLIGAHMLMAVIAASVLRLNLPAALMGAWFMNPLTAPVLLPLVYKLGRFLDLTPEVQLGSGYAANFRRFLHQVAEFSLGGLAMGTATAIATYAAVTAAWEPIRRLGMRAKGPRSRRRGHDAAPSPSLPEPEAQLPIAGPITPTPDRTRSTH
jgi:uncharacterized protein (DUF2062 family)